MSDAGGGTSLHANHAISWLTSVRETILCMALAPNAASGVRMTELLAALSLGTDLGMGHPMEHVLRQSFLALRLAERLGLRPQEREVVFYSSVLAWVGCHVDAYEQAKWFGDDRAVKHEIRQVDLGRAIESAAFTLRHIGAGEPLLARARLGIAFLAAGRHDVDAMFDNHWRAADALAEQLGLDQAVRDSVAQTFERWDGKGVPDGARGEELLIATRLVNLADVVEVFHRAGGAEAALAVARARRGTQFDPALVDLLEAAADGLFAELESVTGWQAVLSVTPGLGVELTEAQLDRALEAVADFVDLKSPYTISHSRNVAVLAERAAHLAGLPAGDANALRRAALVHDLGRLGVSNGIWDKEAALLQGERERVRLHPYLTERMLASSPPLVPLARLAGQHHERLDGSGYPRGLTGEHLSPAARILAVADTYSTKAEPRPHRPECAPDEIAEHLRDEVRAGRLDGAAVDAVLRAAGHRVRRRRDWPAGLTAREIDVLRLIARGLSYRQIAEKLVISRKTASNHVERVYTKIGVTNRAMASVFAVRHGLLLAESLDEPPPTHSSPKDGVATP
jgi:HD-GYP domain-containing protein (c-di-GMP phosphodiesterase class II)